MTSTLPHPTTRRCLRQIVASSAAEWSFMRQIVATERRRHLVIAPHSATEYDCGNTSQQRSRTPYLGFVFVYLRECGRSSRRESDKS